MKNKFLLFHALFFAALAGCSRVQVVKTGSNADIVLPPKESGGIAIYRTKRPDYRFEEIGTVSVQGITEIAQIYERMRIEAGKRGADAVVDFKINSEPRTVTQTSTSCSPNGGCHTSMHTSVVYDYTSTGSLIHKLEAKQ